MERIWRFRDLLVFGFVRTGNNKNPTGSENAFNLGEEDVMLADMFDRFKACDQVDTLILARNLSAGALHKVQVSDADTLPFACAIVAASRSTPITFEATSASRFAP